MELSGLRKASHKINLASSTSDSIQFLEHAFGANNSQASSNMIRAITSEGNYVTDITLTEQWANNNHISTCKIADDIILEACNHIKNSPPFFTRNRAPSVEKSADINGTAPGKKYDDVIASAVLLVTEDANMRIKAGAYGVDVCDASVLRKRMKPFLNRK
jgi:hypothetical protein